MRVRNSCVMVSTWWSSCGAAPSASSCRLARRVWRERSCLYGCSAASLDVWSCVWACLLLAYQPTAGIAESMVVLPEHVDFGQQLDIATCDVEAVQLVEGRFEARDGLLGRVAGRDDQQTAVDVGLMAAKRVRLLLELRVVCMGAVLCIMEVFLRGIDLLLQEALLLGDARQQCIQVARLEVGGRLQLVVEIGGDAVAVGHVQFRVHAGWCWSPGQLVYQSHNANVHTQTAT
jgi:hypothetical protein